MMVKHFIITQIDDSQNLEWCDVLVDDTTRTILTFQTERDAENYLTEDADLTPYEITSNNIFYCSITLELDR